MITKQSNNLFATNKHSNAHSNAKHLNAHSHSLQPCNANTNLLKMSKRYTFYLLVFCSNTAHQSWNPFVMTILTISIITIITTDTMRSRKQWSHELKTKSRDLATHAHIAHSLIMIDRTYYVFHMTETDADFCIVLPPSTTYHSLTSSFMWLSCSLMIQLSLYLHVYSYTVLNRFVLALRMCNCQHALTLIMNYGLCLCLWLSMTCPRWLWYVYCVMTCVWKISITDVY